VLRKASDTPTRRRAIRPPEGERYAHPKASDTPTRRRAIRPPNASEAKAATVRRRSFSPLYLVPLHPRYAGSAPASVGALRIVYKTVHFARLQCAIIFQDQAALRRLWHVDAALQRLWHVDAFGDRNCACDDINY
jgi:hypothetical protein